MPQAVVILFGAAFTAISAYQLGRWLLSRLDLPHLYDIEQRAFRFVCGAALLSLLVFVACAARIAYPFVFVLIGLGAILAGVRSAPVREPMQPRITLEFRWKMLFAFAYVGFGFVYFVHAMAPEYSPDGSMYHLGLVGRYLREHGFQPITTSMYAQLSQGIEMLFLFAFAFGRHSAAALVHWVFLMTLPLVIYAYGRRFGIGPAGVGGAILAFVSPVVGIDGSSAYNDVGVATVLFTLFFSLRLWDAERRSGLLVVAGLLAGFAFAIKYTAGIAAVYAVLYVLWRSRAVKPALIVASLAFVSITPWLAKNVIVTGNPVAPFANALFPNPHFKSDFERQYVADMRRFNGVEPREIPLEAFVRGQRLGGLIGPVLLLLPLGLLAGRRPEGVPLLIAAVVFTLPYAGNIGTRFLIPGLPFWTTALCLNFTRAPLFILIAAHGILSWPSIIPRYASPYAWSLPPRVPLKAALRIIPEDRYLRERSRAYVLARGVDQHVPAGERVFTFGTVVADAYTEREILVGFQSSFNQKLRDVILTPLVPEFPPARSREFRMEPREARKLRIVQTADHPLDNWSVSELRIYGAGREIPRESMWRVRAHPNAWDVQRAFDNSPVTRWSTRERARPGMYVEVDLARDIRIDTVRLFEATDSWGPRIALEVADPNGAWHKMGDAPEEKRAEPPGNLRRWAAQEFKLAGVRYLVVEPQDFGADDLRANVRAWGIREVAEVSGARIYHIE